MTRFTLLACLLLTACGAAGAPERPASAEPGITLSGTMETGVARDGS